MAQTISSNASTLLGTAINAQKERSNTVADNLARQGVRGALAKDSALQSLGHLGIAAGDKTVFLDPNLVEALQVSNGKQAYWITVSDTYTKFMKNFGLKENPKSLDMMCQTLRNEILKLNTDISSTQKSTVIDTLKVQLDKFNQIQTAINQYRLAIDQRKTKIVNDEIPTILNVLAQYNAPHKTADDQEVINLKQFDLAQKIGDAVFEQGKGVETGYFSVKVGNAKLLERQSARSLQYTPTSNPQPGVALNSVILDGVAIESQISSGELGGLINADHILRKIQSALDTFANHLEYTLNQIHNEGTGTKPPSLLKGGVGYLGTEGVPIDTNNIVSGSGTLRIAIVNPSMNNQLVDYKDITLQVNESIASLINRINTTAYNVGGTDTFTMSVDAEGIPQIVCSNPAMGLSIGGVGASPAMLNVGTTYSASNSTSFSHFFHLNDIITKNSPTADGLFGNMQIRADLFQNSDRLSGCALDNNTPTGAYAVLDRPPMDRNIFDKLYNCFTKPQHFSTTGDMGDLTMSLLHYGAAITDYYGQKSNESASNVKETTAELQTYQKEFDEKSGINPEKQKMIGMEIARSLSIVYSMMKTIWALEKEELKLLEL